MVWRILGKRKPSRLYVSRPCRKIPGPCSDTTRPGPAHTSPPSPTACCTVPQVMLRSSIPTCFNKVCMNKRLSVGPQMVPRTSNKNTYTWDNDVAALQQTAGCSRPSLHAAVWCHGQLPTCLLLADACSTSNELWLCSAECM